MGPQLHDRPTGAQARERQRWILAGHEDEVDEWRKPRDETPEHRVHRRRTSGVHVVEDDHDLVVPCLQRIQDERDRLADIGAPSHRPGGCGRAGPYRVEDREDVACEAGRVRVRAVEGHRDRPDRPVRQPLLDRRGLPVPGRRRDDGEPRSRIKGAIEPCTQVLAMRAGVGHGRRCFVHQHLHSTGAPRCPAVVLGAPVVFISCALHARFPPVRLCSASARW